MQMYADNFLMYACIYKNLGTFENQVMSRNKWKEMHFDIYFQYSTNVYVQIIKLRCGGVHYDYIWGKKLFRLRLFFNNVYIN